jgi:hypothetical protein
MAGALCMCGYNFILNAMIKSTFPVTIYSLSCPDTGIIKYIGKTQLSLKRRLSAHICQTHGSATKREWIKELKALGKFPLINSIEETDNRRWSGREKYWINKYQSNGLLNKNKGGGGNHRGKTHVIESFKLFLDNNGYSKNVSKNYLCCVSMFLRKYFKDAPTPQRVNSKTIKEYVDAIVNHNTQKVVISALKLFYSEIIKEPQKLRLIKYRYSEIQSPMANIRL